MTNMEDELRAAFARQTGVNAGPVDLADRVISRGRTVRLWRLAAISASGALAVAVLLAVTLVRLSPNESGPSAMDAGAGATWQGGELPVGRPVQVAVFGFHSVRFPDGTEKALSSAADESITQVIPAAGGWVVQSLNQSREFPAATLVHTDDTVIRLSDSVVSVAANETGDRVAVESQGDDGQWVDVIDAASGKPVASTPLPGDVAEAPIVTGWVGSLVVLSAPNGVQTDVWDPGLGSYRSSMSGERLILGPSDQDGQLLSLEVDSDFPNACLSWVDAAKAFTVTARKCGTGLRFGDRAPWVSPDGRHLVSVGPDAKAQALDVRTMTGVRLGLPENAQPVALVWEDPMTALFRLADSAVRCRLDGSRCELAPLPEVDGAAPIGFVNQK
jgi:hypothetical protein